MLARLARPPFGAPNGPEKTIHREITCDISQTNQAQPATPYPMSISKRKTLTLILLTAVLVFAMSYTRLKIFPTGKRIDNIPAADKVLVRKQARKLYLLKQDHVLKQFDISLGRDPRGHKIEQGDSRTPEGKYVLDWKNQHSHYFLSIHISYPNAADRAVARELGVGPGGDIMIHGLPNGLGWLTFFFKGWDWTDGCIAVSDGEMQEIWNSVAAGTPIEILP